MTRNLEPQKYVPGTYPNRKPATKQLVGHYVHRWENRQIRIKEEEKRNQTPSEFPPCISFSRKIGVGTLEIADLLAKKLDFNVADKKIIEEVAGHAKISKKAATFFDERFPGYGNRTLKYLFGEKSFIDSDYSRLLFNTIMGIAGLESTIFVGRGTHLILPRERVLAIRLICSDNFRIQRVAQMMGVSETKAKKQLSVTDKEQSAFFKKVFNKKNALSYEFDMVINLDHFAEPEKVAEIVKLAFTNKFGIVGG